MGTYIYKDEVTSSASPTLDGHQPSGGSGFSTSGSRRAHQQSRTAMRCELTAHRHTHALTASLILETTRWPKSHPRPVVKVEAVCSLELPGCTPNTFATIETWLAQHHLRTIPASWQFSPHGRDDATAWLLSARLTASTPEPPPTACACMTSWILFAVQVPAATLSCCASV